VRICGRDWPCPGAPRRIGRMDASGGASGRSGSAARAEELYVAHASNVYAFCLSRLGGREDAEDAAQTTFLNAFRGLERGVVPLSEAAWLFAIAQNVCLTRRRSASRRRRVELPSDIAESVASPERDGTLLVDLVGALRGLPSRQLLAIVLREWRGLPY